MDEATRVGHISMIRHYEHCYRLKILVDQSRRGRKLENLSDIELQSLHRDMERGRECYLDGVSIEEAGLIRPEYEYYQEVL